MNHSKRVQDLALKSFDTSATADRRLSSDVAGLLLLLSSYPLLCSLVFFLYKLHQSLMGQPLLGVDAH